MAVYGGPDIVTDGLVLHLDAGNRKSYSGSGNTWYSLINNNVGTLTNGPVFDNNNQGSIFFDGLNDYVTVGSISGDFDNFSILFWFYTGLYGDAENILDCNYNVYSPTGNVGPRFELRNVGGQKYLTVLLSGNTSNNSIYQALTAIPNGFLQNNNWYFSGIIKNSANVYTIFNNSISPAISLTQGALSTIGNLQIGRGFHLGGSERYFSSKVACVQIYNTPLSSYQIQQNYNALKGRFGL